MTRISVQAFDHTLQKTDIWLRELMEDLNMDRPKQAAAAYRAVLAVLRDRLPLDEVLHLGAQMPLLIRGLYLEGWNPTQRPRKIRKVEEFFDGVVEVAREAPWFPIIDQVVRGVFAVLSRHVSKGEIIEVIGLLPRELWGLWPEEDQYLLWQWSEKNQLRGQGIGTHGEAGEGDFPQKAQRGDLRGEKRRGVRSDLEQKIRRYGHFQGIVASANGEDGVAQRPPRKYWWFDRGPLLEFSDSPRLRGPRNYSRSDEAIKEDIYLWLQWHADLMDMVQVDIDVHEGVVILRGEAVSRGVRRNLEELVEMVRGVRGVRNEVQLQDFNFAQVSTAQGQKEQDAGPLREGPITTGEPLKNLVAKGPKRKKGKMQGRESWEIPSNWQDRGDESGAGSADIGRVDWDQY